MITFILNNKLVSTDKTCGTSLLDFIRYDQDLHGTKIGCREGDCGACTVLEGKLEDGKLVYKSIVSCLTPIGNAHGKHIVTIEGINMDCLSPIQHAFVANAATQCGFCTPGFVMSLTGHSLSYEKSNKEKAIASVSGNICRCTGYKSIEKAAEDISCILKDKNINDPIVWMVEKEYLPKYFLNIPKRLSEISKNEGISITNDIIIAGGTDLMVQKAEEISESQIILFQGRKELKGINIENNKCFIGAATTGSMIEQSPIIRDMIPDITNFFKLISSEPIRNMGTIAGNIVNASPIGDLSIILLALNADIIINGVNGDKTIPLKKFYLGYKKLALSKGEYIKSISFPIIGKSLINFEKVSKRTHLDIASVNSAIKIDLDGDLVKDCFISAGGVSPIPLFLSKTSEYLKGKTVCSETLIKANEIMQSEISPIGDVRGSIEYKRLLLRQLLFAHFIKLFPERIKFDDLVNRKDF